MSKDEAAIYDIDVFSDGEATKSELAYRLVKEFMQHDPNCAIVRLRDNRAWCDFGKVKETNNLAKLTKMDAGTK